MDRLWDTVGRQVHIHSHAGRFSGVWRLQSVVSDEVTMIMSVGADGSMRYSPTCYLIEKIVARNIQLFRVVSVTTSAPTSTPDRSIADSNPGKECGWTGKVGKIRVSLDCTDVISEGSHSLLPDPAVGLHAMSSSALSSAEGGVVRDAPGRFGRDASWVLLACGGAAGLVRIHAQDLVEPQK